MFTGIIETVGIVKNVLENGTNKTFEIESTMATELKIDQSVSHNGTCLTVESITNNIHTVTAIYETLQKTNLGTWQQGTSVNLERCVQANGRFDGHFVSGHIDTTGTCTLVLNKQGSWEYTFQFDGIFATNIIEKGSIAINGISLTIFNIGVNVFTVAIIPYTYQHTNMHTIEVGTVVNLEFDMIGKYIARRNEIV